MWIPGLVSVTFRRLPREEVLRLAAENGLRCIEWGGDVHVPPGDPVLARAVGRETRAAGLEVASYGSYYRLGTHGDAFEPAFRLVLKTALALGAPAVRIWAGTRGSAQTDEASRRVLAAEAKRLAQTAAAVGVTLVLESHNDTLTDRMASALRFLEEADAENLMLCWQPNERIGFAENLAAARAALPHAPNLHVFYWPAPGRREPLAAGAADWRQYLAAAPADGKTRRCMLEFMPDDAPASLPGEADALRKLLRGA